MGISRRTPRRRARAAHAATLAGVLFLALAGGAQAKEAQPADPRARIVVDGDDWLRSSGDQRQAFLVGVANMIVAEAAYAKQHAGAMPPVGDRIVKAVTGMKLHDVEARITRWYEANPNERSMPVMAVVWRDVVGPRR